MLQQLKKRADSFDNWCKEAEATLHCSPDDKKGKTFVTINFASWLSALHFRAG